LKQAGPEKWLVIRSFRNDGTQDVFNDRRSRAARRICPDEIWRVARRKLEQIDSVSELRLLNIPPGNELEALKGDRKGQHSIRINKQYRVVFKWTSLGAEDVEIVDYH
jgi:proteic killer suppression protein